MTTSSSVRVRTRSEPDKVEKVERFEYVPAVLGTYTVGSLSESMTDVVTPGYAKKIAAGKVINNDCEYIKVEVISEGSGLKTGSLSSGDPSKDQYLTGPLTRYHVGDRVHTDGLSLSAEPAGMAESRFNALANVDSTPYSFGEDLGEMKKTLEFLKNPLKSIFGMTKSMQRDLRKDFNLKRKKQPRTRKQKLDYARNRAESASDVYLTYRFGLTPLVRSAHDAIEALSYRINTSPERRTARGYSNWSTSDSSDAWILGVHDFHYNYGYSIEKRWRSQILYEVSNPSFKWQRDLGLRGKDLPHTAWQLVPLSFMVDRVVDISSAIRGLTNLADPNVKILAASTSIKKDEQQWHQLIGQETSGWTWEVTGEKRINKEFVYKRITYRPSIADTIPRVNTRGLVDSATKLADLSAIIVSNLRGFGRP